MTRVVESPCVRNCCLNGADICVGCFRSLEEITHWSTGDNEAKMQILSRAAERRLLLQWSKPAVDGNGTKM